MKKALNTPLLSLFGFILSTLATPPGVFGQMNAGEEETSAERPNIILIMADGLGYTLPM